MRLWNSWDEEERSSAIRILGLCALAFALFFLIALGSYLFTWKQDMSQVEDYANAAGRLGYLTSRFFICDLFGLGSFALSLIFIATAISLLKQKWTLSFIRTTLISLFGAFISSLLFAYIGRLLAKPLLFGGGLGGRCGDYAICWSEEQFGVLVTGIFILLLILALCFFSSKRFNRWFASIGNGPNAEERAARRAARKAEKEAKRKQKIEEEMDEEDLLNQEHQTLSQQENDGIMVEPFLPDNSPIEEDSKELEELSLKEDKGSSPIQENFEIIEGTELKTENIEELEPIDNRLDPPDGLPKFQFPSLDLLKSYNENRTIVSNQELTRNNNKIRYALANYKIQVKEVKAVVGPTITLYKVYPAEGVKIANIKRLQEDIAMSLNAKGVRVTVLSDCVGIEVANDTFSIVPLKALLNDEAFRNSKADLPIAIGYTITQNVKVFDLADAPHLLIAGATKQGKSVGLNVIVTSLLYGLHPSELKFVFIDPKMVEFSAYSKLLHHYLAVLPNACSEEDEQNNAIVKNSKDAELVLRSLCIEMDERYELLSKAGVNNIKLYNSKYKERKLRPDKGHRFLPYLVVVVDEYADLTMTTGASRESAANSRSITNSIIRLAQKGRAAGLHVILATQRPSVDVISGLIKSNFPMRIAFRVASKTDSMTILDTPGAEKLIGRGDMLFSAGIDSERIQCGYISGDEIDNINKCIGEQKGYGKSYNTPYYLPAPAEDNSSEDGAGAASLNKIDERFEEAAKMVVLSQRGSTSDLQRKLGMGYAKAGRVMDQLEAAGIVGPQDGSKPRQVLISDLDSLQAILDSVLKK